MGAPANQKTDIWELMTRGLPKPFIAKPVFEDTHNNAKPFAPHYEQYMKPLIEKFEYRRIETLRRLRRRILILLPLL